MTFLVVSTSVCLIRNTPKMLREARSFREHVRASSLRAFPHRVQTEVAQPVSETAQGVTGLLGQFGYAVRERRDGDGIMLAAKKGSANRLSYIFAHSAMVIICIGGLLDKARRRCGCRYCSTANSRSPSTAKWRARTFRTAPCCRSTTPATGPISGSGG